MGLMSYLRSRAGLVIFVIGLAIVAFLLGDIINYGTPFWMKNQNEVGSVNGEGIDYQTFNQQVDQAVAGFQQQMGGGSSPEMTNYAVQQVWNQYVSEELLKQEIAKIGISVGKDELNNLVFGENPSPQILQMFTNPQTGQYDKNQVAMVSSQAKTNPEVAQQWEALLESIRAQRLNEKYSNLLSNSMYTTALEAEQEHNSRNKIANFKYVMLDYASVKDSEVKLADSDYKEYYDKHKKSFRNTEEVRSLEFVSFDARPTAADTAMILSEVNQLKSDLQNSSTEEQLAASVSETKYPVRYYSKNQLNPALDSVVFNVAAGTVVGPFLSGNSYEIAKVLDTKFSPDSVEASHILLNPVAEGGVEQAKVKADSIKKLIQSGESIAGLAVEFSVDEGSKVNGGSLGTFTRGRMIPAFEDAAFGGKSGDVVVVESDYGIHILKIERQIGNSKIAKTAIIDKSIVAGRATQDAAYAKANAFYSEANKDNFKEVAGKQNLNLQTSARTLAMDNSLNGTTIPRELIRWAFEAKNGEVSDKVYESDSHYIVARVTGVQEKGIQPLESVKGEIQPAVRNMVKARMLKEKLNNAISGSSTIEQISQKVGKNVQTVENVVFANPVIPGVALENAVVGTVFGLQPNKPSAAVEGNQGVYAVQVIGFVNPKALSGEELNKQQRQMMSTSTQRAWGGIFRALQDKAKIDDNRIRFY
ncbi:SurA N-terminal domain-containing protein [Sphingobacterium corticis]|uniref:Periplasmic chaperone PpiD n=1 Tax=Sphingobacterium corticis TaxID=1812823 RepID=A0ABW5NMT0_9SPHI